MSFNQLECAKLRVRIAKENSLEPCVFISCTIIGLRGHIFCLGCTVLASLNGIGSVEKNVKGTSNGAVLNEPVILAPPWTNVAAKPCTQ